jgi:predicted negative regulator of RcsB-dependent stress response
VARQRITRKDLKQPDQFITTTGRVLEWIRGHTRHVLYGVLGIVVLIGLILGWASWKRQREHRAAGLLQQAMTLSETASGSDRAVDTPETIEKLKVITQRYGGTSAGAQAYLRLGHLYFERGDTAAALAAYEQARQRLPRHHQISIAIATLNMGYAQEAAGACDQAIANFASVRQSPVAWLHGEAYLGLGRCHEQNQAPDKAIAIYDQALADAHVTETVKQTINERLAQLQPPAAAAKAPQAPSEAATPSPRATDTPSAQEAHPKPPSANPASPR